jgi:exopolysaccharide biosynthesis polyprenyl glycosylphosphotransferase
MVTSPAISDSDLRTERPHLLARTLSPLASSSIMGGRWVQFAYVLIDLCFIQLTFLAVSRFHFGEVITVDPTRAPISPHSLGFLLMYGSLVVLLCHAQGLYRTSRGRSRSRESLAIAQAIIAGTSLLTAFMYLSGMQTESRFSIAASAVLNTIFLSLWRVWKRGVVERRVAAGIGVTNVLIVGAGSVGREIADHLDRNKHLGLAFKGFVADQDNAHDPKILGNIEELPSIARTEFADEIIITIPLERESIRRAIFQARRSNLDVKVAFDLPRKSGHGAVLEHIGGLPVVSLCREPIPMMGHFVKTIIDLSGSALALFCLSPVFLAIALAIKIDSSGPILYRALRAGKKRRNFVCYKFRTMVSNADALKGSLQQFNERNGATFKLSNDPRVTRVGRILRKYSLDELPQVWNVFRGDMSLVGPRPHPLDDCTKYNLEHLRRLDVTPGLTGLWQVMARRDPSFDRNVALDLEYIENWSLGLDLRILAKTLGVVLAGSGV